MAYSLDLSWMPFLAPQLFLLIGALALPWLHFAGGVSKKMMGWFALIASLLALGWSVLMTTLIPGANFAAVFGLKWGMDGYAVLGGGLVVDAFSAYFQMLFLAICSLCVAASLNYVSEEHNVGEFYSLILIATLGMTLVAMARDLFTLYVGVEVASIASIALTAFRKRDPKSVEGGAKFLIIAGVSSAFVLFGLSLVYGVAGTTNIAALAAQPSPLAKPGFQPITTMATVFLLVGFGFKITAVPFHMWAPDVYEGAPTPVSAFLSAGSKKMGFAAMFYVFVLALAALRWNATTPAEQQHYIEILLGGVAVATMVFGNLFAIAQANLKRMLAYSSIAQAGYMLIAVTIGDPIAVGAGLFYMLVHVFMKAGAFFTVGLLGTHVGETVDSYKGLRYRSPFGAFAMTAFLFSLAGIPPMGGFWAKWFVFYSAWSYSQGHPGNHAWSLAVVGVIMSAISLYYYLRVVYNIYVAGEEDRARLEKLPVPHDLAMLSAVGVCLVMVFFIGLWPQPFLDQANIAAIRFFQPPGTLGP